MSKQKTNKSAARRFKITGTGKLTHRVAFSRHLRTSKSGAQKRRQKQIHVLTGRVARTVKRMMAKA